LYVFLVSIDFTIEKIIWLRTHFRVLNFSNIQLFNYFHFEFWYCYNQSSIALAVSENVVQWASPSQSQSVESHRRNLELDYIKIEFYRAVAITIRSPDVFHSYAIIEPENGIFCVDYQEVWSCWDWLEPVWIREK